MKKNLILVAVAAATLLCACNTGGKYETDGKYVYQTYWTFSFGTMHDTLPEADASTFVAVKDWLGYDARHAYFKNRLIEGADVASLKAKHYPLCRDRRDYYYMGRAMHVADVEKFKVLKWSDDDCWAIDGHAAYYDSTRFDVDIATFKVRSWCHATDKDHVYRYGRILEGADPATYEEEWKGYYSRDKAHIWYIGELIEDADYATFVVDGDSDAHDAHGKFHGARRITNE